MQSQLHYGNRGIKILKYSIIQRLILSNAYNSGILLEIFDFCTWCEYFCYADLYCLHYTTLLVYGWRGWEWQRKGTMEQ
jgi:hypothetical protein